MNSFPSGASGKGLQINRIATWQFGISCKVVAHDFVAPKLPVQPFSERQDFPRPEARGPT